MSSMQSGQISPELCAVEKWYKPILERHENERGLVTIVSIYCEMCGFGEHFHIDPDTGVIDEADLKDMFIQDHQWGVDQ